MLCKMGKNSLKIEFSEKIGEILKSFFAFFQKPLAQFNKVFYNNSTVVESGAKCSEIPQIQVQSDIKRTKSAEIEQKCTVMSALILSIIINARECVCD